MTTDLTLGFQGLVNWVAETSYGDGVQTDDTTLLVSNQVQAVRVSHTKGSLGETRNIGSYDVDAFVYGTLQYGVTIEYLADKAYDSTESLIARSLDRTSGDVASLAILVGVGTSQGTTNKAYFNLKGCKAKTINVSTDEDAPVRVAIDYSVQDVSTSTAAVTTTSDTISTQPWKFTGGSFKRGGSASWGYIVGAVSMVIDNGLLEGKDIGNTTILGAYPGARGCTGTVNVCLTDGGRSYWTDAESVSTDAIEFDFGASSSAPSMRLESAVLGSIEIPIDSDSAIVMTTIPFTGTTPIFEVYT